MDENAPVRLPWLHRLADFLKGLFTYGKKPELDSYSKFRLMIMDMTPDEPGYKQAGAVAELCEEGVKIAVQRVNFMKKMREVDERLAELEAFDRMTDEEVEYLQRLLDRHTSISGERAGLIYQLADFDSSLKVMLEVGEDAGDVMPHIEDAEKKQRILRLDLSHLQGEKSSLEYERLMLEKGMVFINRFALGMVILFAGVAILLFYLYIFLQAQIFVPTSIFILLVITVVSLLFFFRRRMAFELELNLKKQNKAIELINKKNVVFVYYTNFLNYEYKKYQVRSSQMLKSNLHDFAHYKHLTKRIDAMRKSVEDTENEIETFLKRFKMGSTRSVIDKYALTASLSDKKVYYRELSDDRQAFENNLSILDARHEAIWDRLVALNQTDQTEERLINKLIQVYVGEVSKIVPTAET